MSSGGTYRIDDLAVPVPMTEWIPAPLGALLNNLPVNGSYYGHKWAWPGRGLEPCVFEDILAKFESQQTTLTQLTALETDPFDASLADETYGTTVYTDFIILSISPRRRGLPQYDNPTVEFLVYVG